MLPTKFLFVWPSCVRVEDFLEIDKSEKRIVCGGHIWDWEKISNIYKRTFHRCFLPSFGSFGHALSEEIFRNRRIRNKNWLWWPCLLMGRDRISNLYSGPSIDASYQVLVHLAMWFQRRRFLEIYQ